MRPPQPNGQVPALTGNEVASANTTLNTLIGGKQKSWMTGHAGVVRPTPRTLAHSSPVSNPSVTPTSPAAATPTSTAGVTPGSVESQGVNADANGRRSLSTSDSRPQPHAPSRNSSLPNVQSHTNAARGVMSGTWTPETIPRAAQRSPARPNPAQPSPARPVQAQTIPQAAQRSPAQPNPAQPSPAPPGQAQPSPAQASQAWPSQAQQNPVQYTQLPALITPTSADSSMLNMLNYKRMLDEHIARHGGQNRLEQTVEKPRFTLLSDACLSGDFFFVLLHQLFCLWSTEPNQVRAFLGTGDSLAAGFHELAKIIRSNDGFSPVHLQWCSQFPFWTAQIQQSGAFQLTARRVLTFLNKLVADRGALFTNCRRRGYPTLVHELVSQLGLFSSVLQQVFFTASRRSLGVDDHNLGVRMEDIFRRDRGDYDALAARSGTPSPPTAQDIETHNSRMAQAYRYVLDEYVQRQRLRNAGLHVHIPAHSPTVDPASTSAQPHNTVTPLQLQSGPGAPLQSPGLAGRFQALSYQPAPGNLPTTTGPSAFPVLRSNIPQNIGMPANMPIPNMNNGTANYPNFFAPNMGPPAGMGATAPYRTPYGNGVQTAPLNSPASRQAQIGMTVQGGGVNQRPNQFLNGRQPQQTLPQAIPPNWSNGIPPTRQATQASMAPGSQILFPSQIQPSSISAQRAPGRTTVGPRRQESNGNSNLAPAVPTNFIPSARQQLPLGPPKPDVTAMHQLLLRSPYLSTRELPGVIAQDPTLRYFQVVRGFAVGPVILSRVQSLSIFEFVVPEKVHAWSVARPQRLPGGVMANSYDVKSGTLLYRMRCIQVKAGETKKDNDWVVAETTWPSSIFMAVNADPVDLRRKIHHGKDLPANITEYIKKGLNEVRLSVPRSEKDKSQPDYAFVVEIVEILQHKEIVDMAMKGPHISAAKTLDSIKTSLSGSMVDDEEISMAVSDLTLNLADPFMSVIFNIPVRGTRCKHRECFDLETFLNTRMSKPKYPILHPEEPQSSQLAVDVWKCSQPAAVDVWKCPLCGKDARPYSLQVDDFLVSVREQLKTQNLLGTKAIVISADGTWKPKSEDIASTSRKRSASRAGLDDSDSEDEQQPRETSKAKSVEVIDLDDD